MKTLGGHVHFGATPVIFVLVLSGNWHIGATVDKKAIPELRSKKETQLDQVIPNNNNNNNSIDGEIQSDDGEEPDPDTDDHPHHLSPTDRLPFCNEATVSGLTAFHFQILETGFREYRCWTPRLGRLMSLLRQELTRGGGGRGWSSSGGGGSRRLSANEGYRLRCRILFKYDTCRSNFAKYRSMDNPEIPTEWPEEVLDVINDSL